MEVTIYANYGMLAHEYTPVFTLDSPISRPYDRLVVEIPDSTQDENGEIWVKLPGRKGQKPQTLKIGEMYPYTAELVAGKKDAPVLKWYAGMKPLKVLKRTNWEHM